MPTGGVGKDNIEPLPGWMKGRLLPETITSNLYCDRYEKVINE
jgi:hypothetical protein